uniref:Uncharacterized protein n=1 Tax=Glossina austeni TaxID=7395 RepID=A0A1A9UIW3_GLOAU
MQSSCLNTASLTQHHHHQQQQQQQQQQPYTYSHYHSDCLSLLSLNLVCLFLFKTCEALNPLVPQNGFHWMISSKLEKKKEEANNNNTR